ncbi:hypothetical protein [Pedobacter sp. Leaf250]|uniref:hypothetical protein n=1 Tax=Pedobacter sp. Leaf250 TaxID=2876559 RepID=UPI001E3256B3|nr:hypothetical protein [Pedobacter sp. Leaf250]
MKKILIALVFAMLGTASFANDAKPIKTPTISKNIVETSTSPAKLVKVNVINETSNLVRREKVFLYTDPCGVKWQIHVFAPDGTDNLTMFLVGNGHFWQGIKDSPDGCYHNH